MSLLAWIGSSNAATLDWLYDVEFEVADQSAQVRLNAFREGLEIVLLRVTGLRQLPDLEALDAAFENLNAYQLQFHYLDRHEIDDPEVGLRLHISYDMDAVQTLVRALQLPVWTAQRPRVLFLISVAAGNQRTVLSQSNPHELQDVISAAAYRRGIAYSQPLMDFSDSFALREGSIAFNFLTDIGALTSRLQADLVVSARVDPIPFRRYRVWLHIYDGTDRRLRIFDESSLSTAIKGVVYRTADELADRYAVLGYETTALNLVVEGISSIGEYIAIRDYLEQWEFIDHVLVRSVKLDRFEFELRTASSWEQFVMHLEEDGALIPLEPDTSLLNPMPTYVWRGS